VNIVLSTVLSPSLLGRGLLHVDVLTLAIFSSLPKLHHHFSLPITNLLFRSGFQLVIFPIEMVFSNIELNFAKDYYYIFFLAPIHIKES